MPRSLSEQIGRILERDAAGRRRLPVATTMEEVAILASEGKSVGQIARATQKDEAEVRRLLKRVQATASRGERAGTAAATRLRGGGPPALPSPADLEARVAGDRRADRLARARAKLSGTARGAGETIRAGGQRIAGLLPAGTGKAAAKGAGLVGKAARAGGKFLGPLGAVLIAAWLAKEAYDLAYGDRAARGKRSREQEGDRLGMLLGSLDASDVEDAVGLDTRKIARTQGIMEDTALAAEVSGGREDVLDLVAQNRARLAEIAVPSTPTMGEVLAAVRGVR